MINTVLLGDEIELIGGGTPKTSNKEYWDGDIPWLSVVDFGGEKRWVDNTEKTITKLGLEKSSTKLLQVGDIIISARGTVGEISQLKKPMAFNQSCYGVRAKRNIDQNYLYYLLKFSVADLQRQAHGGVFNTITRETFQHIEINLPNLEIQKKIADILSSLDEKIELNRKMNETLEQMGQALFRHCFVDNVEAEGWKIGKFEDVADVTTGKGSAKSQLSESGVVPLYGANGIMGTSEKYLYDDNLIITGRVGTLGAVRAVTGKAWFSDNVLIMKPKPGYFGFVYHLAKSFDYNAMNRGSSQPLITQTDLKNLPITIPEKSALLEFEDKYADIFNMIQTNSKEIQTLTNLRDTLLPRLISGKIELS